MCLVCLSACLLSYLPLSIYYFIMDDYPSPILESITWIEMKLGL